MKRAIFAFTFFSLTLPAFGQGVDPLIGTWKINPAKSTSTVPIPKSWTHVEGIAENGQQYHSDLVWDRQ
jgi:hypothetical protein